MKDLTIALENRPGALAKMGEALGRAVVSIEGGGAWGRGRQRRRPFPLRGRDQSRHLRAKTQGREQGFDFYPHK